MTDNPVSAEQRVTDFGPGSDWDAEAHVRLLRAGTGPSSGYTADLIERLFSSLSALSPVGVSAAAEPVAWRWRWDGDAPWSYGDTRPTIDRIQGDPDFVESLYTDPTAGERDKALDEAAEAVGRHDVAGREWAPNSFWGQVTNEAVSRIRALKEKPE